MARASTVHIHPPQDRPWEQPGGPVSIWQQEAALCPDTEGGGKIQRLEPVPDPAAWSPQPPLPTQGLRPNTSTTEVGQNEFLAVQAISSFKPDLQWLPVFLLL